MNDISPAPSTIKTLRLPDPIWARIKIYQHARMLPSEQAAVREVIEMGLEAGEASIAPFRRGRGK